MGALLFIGLGVAFVVYQEARRGADFVTTVLGGHGVNPNGRDLSVLHPSLQALLAWADAQEWESGHITITSTVRTKAKQAELYEIGRTVRNPWTDDGTELGPTVAPSTDPAQHGYRGDGYVHAFDFSYASLTPADRDAFVAQAEGMGLQWGGRWKSPDLVHIETKLWRQAGPAPAGMG